jgi:hypothetical protein
MPSWANAHRSAWLVSAIPELCNGEVHRVQDTAGMAQEDAPVLGDGDPARGAHNELDPELFLQIFDVVTERGLGDAETLRSGGK